MGVWVHESSAQRGQVLNKDKTIKQKQNDRPEFNNPLQILSNYYVKLYNLLYCTSSKPSTPLKVSVPLALDWMLLTYLLNNYSGGT